MTLCTNFICIFHNLHLNGSRVKSARDFVEQFQPENHLFFNPQNKSYNFAVLSWNSTINEEKSLKKAPTHSGASLKFQYYAVKGLNVL